MSMARGCEAVEVEPKKWFCFLATDEYDYDFRNYTTYGPARSADEAIEMACFQNSNPGGYSSTPQRDDNDLEIAHWADMLAAQPAARPIYRSVRY